MPKDDLPILAFASPREWEAWLETQHAASRGVWLKFAKKGSGVASVTYAEALDAALCYGWIDGQVLSHDERFYLQRFTPRARRSKWSRINRDKVLALMGQGRMQPAGFAQVEQAQRDGRWEAAYEPPSGLTIPADLQQALDERPTAAAFFATLDSRNRYAILYRLHDAKRAETRARRLAQFVALLEAQTKLIP